MTSKDSRSWRTGRRSYLHGCLVGAGGLAATGVGSASEACELETAAVREEVEPDEDEIEVEEPEETTDPDDLEDQYETVVDVVEAGADPSGSESITPVLREVVGDDTLLKFPEGRYYMDDQLRFTGFDNVGFIGDGATLVPASYHDFSGTQHRLFRLGTFKTPGRNLRFENFEIDQTADETGIRVINGEVEDGLLVRNITVRGLHDSGTWGPGLFNITDSDGAGLVEGFRAPDGALHADDTPNAGNMWRGATGFHTNPYHKGTIVYRDCELGGFPGTGLYASNETGRVGVDGGYFKNSGTASVRLNGTTGKIVDAEIEVTEDPHGTNGQHAIRLGSGSHEIDNISINMPNPNGSAIKLRGEVERTVISNTEITIDDHPSDGIEILPEAGPVTIENVDIEINGSANAVRILGDDGGAVELKDVQITGDADGSQNQEAIFCQRDGSKFVDLFVEQRGADNRRALDIRGSNVLVSDSEFETTHTPIAINGADDVTIEDTTSRAIESGYSLRIVGNAGSVDLEDNALIDGLRDDR